LGGGGEGECGAEEEETAEHGGACGLRARAQRGGFPRLVQAVF
jgi:hypothetical protein